ncbi:carbohydrate-binding family 6 protein [Novipirellula artificiosorum]|uniref:Carbohydrate-binding family 6 protein n=1 Tax=Novipirellula artificiosorum TaxID=2528016 RepID=A0A5C6DC67_9BACT|nr:carbohydrate-binding family 6 protein [Novipirellula artificiosorum]TWU33367.1 hypothetical protein Poly41_51210 [Novipirellula artificiosorum]
MRYTNCCTLLIFFFSAITISSEASGEATIKVNAASAPAAFGAAEIRHSLETRPVEGDWQIHLGVDASNGNIRPEGFQLEVNKSENRIDVIAVDPAGLLYGGLEVAEVIRTAGIDAIKPTLQNPYMQMRGTKFNIPLDVRTPSYTDVCDAAQKNIPEMWSFEFWKEYIDTLARYRYNFVSLWNLHPFPSMVKVPAYPDVALEDVWRSNVKWDEHYSLEGKDFVNEEILADVEVVRKMTIDEKIDFWKRVMAYGKSRNVNFYVVTWNIFTYGTDGKYGITDDPHNETTRDYFRQSVKELLLTYPDLAGVGLTTGENMHGMDFQEKEDWAMATYGQGTLDAAQQKPDRKITFIHRQHMAKAQDISRTFEPLAQQSNVNFIFSFKYAKAHVYSATTQPYHDNFVKDLGDMKTIWTLRNDDVYYFRWGAADFVREFVRNIPHDVSLGYYYGSDQYVWGREFLQRDVEGTRELEITKHWYQWMLWGRLAYAPQLSNERFRQIIAERFALSPSDASKLFDAWQNASMIYPTTTGFHWGPLDFQWYIEACQSRESYAENETGFHDVNRFISLAPHPKSRFQSIKDFVAGKPKPDDVLTPFQVADRLDEYASKALDSSSDILSQSTSGELPRTLADIKIVSELGAYYADKIRGATELASFRNSPTPASNQKAIRHLVDAARHFHAYVSLATQDHLNPLWTNRVGIVDWKQTYAYTLQDIRIAGGDPADFELPPEF